MTNILNHGSRKKFRILIYPGLHTRPGAKFVELCNKFESDIEILLTIRLQMAKVLST